MRKALARIAHLIGSWSPSAAAPVPFQVPCACGHVMTGFRLAQHQVLACSRCGQPVFVMPRSPLPPVAPLPAGSQGLPTAVTPPAPRRRWLGPAVAVLVTGALVALVFVVLINYLTGEGQVTGEEIQTHYRQGKQALAEGDFGAAARELAQASDGLARNATALSPAEGKELRQLAREAALLADWPGEPLEAVLQRAAQLKDPEWQRVVDLSRGKAFVFAVELRRDPAGRYHQRFLRPEAARLLRLELDNLLFLKQLPLQEGRPVLFAARLVDVQREAEGPASVRLDPASGTLLTALPVARLQCLQVPEPKWQEVIARQKQWLDLPP